MSLFVGLSVCGIDKVPWELHKTIINNQLQKCIKAETVWLNALQASPSTYGTQCLKVLNYILGVLLQIKVQL